MEALLESLAKRKLGDGNDALPDGRDVTAAPLTLEEMESQVQTLLRSFSEAGVDPQQAVEQLPELGALLKTVAAAKSAKNGQPQTADGPSTEVLPEPGFVVKTMSDQGVKVFINMCGSTKIASPGGWKAGRVPEEVEKAIMASSAQENGTGAGATDEDIAAARNALRFPISMGDPRPDMDNSGTPCIVLDAMFNVDVIKQAMAHRRLKVFLIELAMGWAAQKHKLQLDAQYKLPRMNYKGQPAAQRVRVDPDVLIQEVSSSESDEVTFPLMPKRLPLIAPAKPPSGLGSSSSSVAISAVVPVASTPNTMLPRLESALSFEGRPTEWVNIRVTFPGTVADILSTLVRAAVLYDAVLVEIPGCVPALIQLPFGVSGVGGTAEVDPPRVGGFCLDSRAVRIRLPFKPISEALRAARQAAPHALGALPLKTDLQGLIF